MNFNITTDEDTFTALNRRQRHLITKHNPLLIPGDTVNISQPDSREQISMEVVSIEVLNTRQTLLGLFAPYTTEDDLGDLFNNITLDKILDRHNNS